MGYRPKRFEMSTVNNLATKRIIMFVVGLRKYIFVLLTILLESTHKLNVLVNFMCNVNYLDARLFFKRFKVVFIPLVHHLITNKFINIQISR